MTSVANIVSGNTEISQHQITVGDNSANVVLDDDGNINADGTLAVLKAATFSNTVGITGAATLSNTVGVTGAATLSNTVGVSGPATFSNTVDVAGSEILAQNDFEVRGNSVYYTQLTAHQT